MEVKEMNHKFLFLFLIISGILTSGCTGGEPQKSVSFDIVNVYGNPLVGAEVNVAYNSTTASSGISEQINKYGTGMQSGTTDTSGGIVFTMTSTVKYDVIVQYQGMKMVYQIYPKEDYYMLRFQPPAPPDTSLAHCVYANGNTKTSSFQPDPEHVTIVWSYQDTCDLTTRVDFYLVDADLNKVVYQTSIDNPGTTIAKMTHTVVNERGKSYTWYENGTRSV
jgi:hypothetical protein